MWVLHELMGTNEMKDQFETSIKLLKKLQLNSSYPTDKRFRARENIIGTFDQFNGKSLNLWDVEEIFVVARLRSQTEYKETKLIDPIYLL